MKKASIIGLIAITIFFAFYIIWLNLPVTINRNSDIKLGNEVIEKTDSYLIKNGKLPNWNDWKTLKNLGIQFDYESTRPEFKNLNDSIYELYFIEGFDGPYLMWNSTERKWKMGFPTYVKK